MLLNSKRLIHRHGAKVYCSITLHVKRNISQQLFYYIIRTIIVFYNKCFYSCELECSYTSFGSICSFPLVLVNNVL